MTINKANVKKAVLAVNPDLRVSKEFYEGLDELVQAEVKKAVERLTGNPKNGVTVKKAHLKD